MSDYKRLSEVLGDTQNIFTRIMTAHEVPWNEDESITGALLDFEYLNNQSGDKIISPAVEKALQTVSVLPFTFSMSVKPIHLCLYFPTQRLCLSTQVTVPTEKT